MQEGDSLGRDVNSIDTDTVGDWAFPGGVDAEGAATPGSRNGPEDSPTIGPTDVSPSPAPSATPSLSMNPTVMLPTSFPFSDPTSPSTQASRVVQAVPTKSLSQRT